MSHVRCICTPIALAALCWGAAAGAAEVEAKLVWFDAKNNTLLLECPEKGCAAIPDAKPGETYTFVIPASVRSQAAAAKEGDTVRVVFEEAKGEGYVVSAISK